MNEAAENVGSHLRRSLSSVIGQIPPIYDLVPPSDERLIAALRWLRTQQPVLAEGAVLPEFKAHESTFAFAAAITLEALTELATIGATLDSQDLDALDPRQSSVELLIACLERSID